MMTDERRCMNLIKETEGIYFDFSRQRVTLKTIEVSLLLSHFVVSRNSNHTH